MVGQSRGGMLSAGQTLALRGSACLFHIVLRAGGSLFCHIVLPPMVLLTADSPLSHTPMLVAAAAAAEVKKPNLSAELEKHGGDRS
jgi:predicted esterase